MADKIKVFQKPTCSKCREAIGVLKERGADFESINYYEAPLTEKDLKALIRKLGIAPRELLRNQEQVYRDLGLAKRESSDDELIRLMIEKPGSDAAAHSRSRQQSRTRSANREPRRVVVGPW